MQRQKKVKYVRAVDINKPLDAQIDIADKRHFKIGKEACFTGILSFSEDVLKFILKIFFYALY